MNYITKSCLHCQQNFEASAKEHNRGNAKFCSRKCSGEHRSSTKKPMTPNVICSHCFKPFHKSKSRIEKSRAGYFFCSRSCKDNAQKWYDNPNPIIEIMPDHYGKGNDHRVIAFLNYDPKCHDCGYDEHPEILEVHHLDCDHSNNEVENLTILCPTCHEKTHYLSKTGRWKKDGGG